MILTKTISLKVNGKMVKKYKEMGFNVKQHDNIELTIDKLSKYSHLKVLCACDICGNEKEIKYNNYCKYISKDGIYTCKICNLEKRKNTCLKKYGTDNVSKNEKVKEKVKKTMIENGNNYFFKTEEYEKFMIDKYGFSNPSKSSKIKLKKEETCLKNYGVSNPSKSSKIKLKKEETCFKNYGVTSPSKSFEIHKKQHSGYIQKHHISGLHYRGTYEKDFIDYCLIHNIEIENFNGTINYFFDGKNRKYFPDFFIRKLNMVIEIKSLYIYERDKEKNEAKKEATINSGFDFKFIINKDYSFFVNT
jgi:hypothetical protein